MPIRLKLLLLVIFLGLVLVVNLLALTYLAHIVTTALETVEEVGLNQQLVTVRMQAQLRDAEAALYRYIMEGEAGFAIQFAEQLHRFEQDAAHYQAHSLNVEQQGWAGLLLDTHRQAADIGQELIQLRDRQTGDLADLDAALATLNTLLTGPIRSAHPDSEPYQAAVSGMHQYLREMALAVTSYLASPRETEPVRFSEAAVGFRQHLAQFQTLAGAAEGRQVDRIFAQIEALGLRLMSGRDQQQALFANFAAILFRAGDEVLVGQIQPRAALNLATARQRLQAALNFAITASLVFALSVSVLAGAVTWPLFRQMNRGISALLQGAERVAAGNLIQPVILNGRDELSRLAAAFNRMMSDLAIRERDLQARLSDLADRETRLQALAQKLAHVQEEERRLIGLDLHDGLTQLLLSANMHLNTLASLSSHENGQAGAELELVRARLQEAISEARQVVSELRPTALEDYGLVGGLRHYVTEMSHREGWQFEFITPPHEIRLKPAIETAVFRIVQEALSNVRKYAATSRIRVALQLNDSKLRLQVKDWGRGFNPTDISEESQHLGLVGMRERAALLNGVCRVTSRPDHGTQIDVSIPLE